MEGAEANQVAGDLGQQQRRIHNRWEWVIRPRKGGSERSQAHTELAEHCEDKRAV